MRWMTLEYTNLLLFPDASGVAGVGFLVAAYALEVAFCFSRGVSSIPLNLGALQSNGCATLSRIDSLCNEWQCRVWGAKCLSKPLSKANTNKEIAIHEHSLPGSSGERELTSLKVKELSKGGTERPWFKSFCVTLITVDSLHWLSLSFKFPFNSPSYLLRTLQRQLIIQVLYVLQKKGSVNPKYAGTLYLFFLKV